MSETVKTPILDRASRWRRAHHVRRGVETAAELLGWALVAGSAGWIALRAGAPGALLIALGVLAAAGLVARGVVRTRRETRSVDDVTHMIDTHHELEGLLTAAVAVERGDAVGDERMAELVRERAHIIFAEVHDRGVAPIALPWRALAMGAACVAASSFLTFGTDLIEPLAAAEHAQHDPDAAADAERDAMAEQPGLSDGEREQLRADADALEKLENTFGLDAGSAEALERAAEELRKASSSDSGRDALDALARARGAMSELQEQASKGEHIDEDAIEKAEDDELVERMKEALEKGDNKLAEKLMKEISDRLGAEDAEKNPLDTEMADALGALAARESAKGESEEEKKSRLNRKSEQGSSGKGGGGMSPEEMERMLKRLAREALERDKEGMKSAASKLSSALRSEKRDRFERELAEARKRASSIQRSQMGRMSGQQGRMMANRAMGQQGRMGQMGQQGQQGQMGQQGQSGRMGQQGQMGQSGRMGQQGRMGQSGQSGQMGQGSSGKSGQSGQMGQGGKGRGEDSTNGRKLSGGQMGKQRGETRGELTRSRQGSSQGGITRGGSPSTAPGRATSEGGRGKQTRVDGSFDEDWVPSQWSEGGNIVTKVIKGRSQGERAGVEYENVHKHYSDIAEEATSREEIPLTRRTFIQRYFEAIRPEQ